MKITNLRVVLFALTVSTALPAAAAFIEETGSGEFRVVGKVDQSVIANGLGRKVLIRDAVRQITPNEYAVQFGPGMDSLAIKRVSWKGGRAWTDVLAESLATVPEISVEIDGNARVVTLSAAGEARTQVTESSGLQSEPQSWVIKSGDKLSETLAAWGRDAGWQSVLWQAPDLVSEMDVTFQGSFKEAVTNTIEALARSGTPLRVVFYGGNKVVRIMESK